jgi:hypothetical protein
LTEWNLNTYGDDVGDQILREDLGRAKKGIPDGGVFGDEANF